MFDGVVAVDAGVDQLFRHGGVTPEGVRELVYGTMFTPGLDDLKHTAIFIGGSSAAAGEALLAAVSRTFFGPMRVSVMLDPNGANTTAAAAVLAAGRQICRWPGPRPPRRPRPGLLSGWLDCWPARGPTSGQPRPSPAGRARLQCDRPAGAPGPAAGPGRRFAGGAGHPLDGATLRGCPRATPPKMVVVGDPVPVGQVQVRERDVAVVLDDQVVLLRRVAELELIQRKGVGLVIKPVERDLDRVVEPRQPHGLANQEPPPHLGLRAHDHHAQAQDALLSLLAPEPLPSCSDIISPELNAPVGVAQKETRQGKASGPKPACRPTEG